MIDFVKIHNTLVNWLFQFETKTNNPYLETFQALNKDFPMIDFRNLGQDQAATMKYMFNDLIRKRARDYLIRYYSFAVPNDQSIEMIINHMGNGLVEYGCGPAYWSWVIAQRVIQSDKIVCFDTLDWGITGEGRTKLWMNVIKCDPDAKVLKDHSKMTLLVVWPGGYLDMALNQYQGDTIIYVGERGGCCDWDERLDNDWEQVDDCEIEQWDLINDHLYVLKRKP